MKIKLFSFFALTCLCFFLIQSCSNENISEEEFNTSSIEIDIDDIDPVPIKYCRYNVTKSSVPGIKVADIVCVECDEPCAEDLTDHVVNYPVNNQGLVSGTRVGKRCKKCPTGGHVI